MPPSSLTWSFLLFLAVAPAQVHHAALAASGTSGLGPLHIHISTRVIVAIVVSSTVGVMLIILAASCLCCCCYAASKPKRASTQERGDLESQTPEPAVQDGRKDDARVQDTRGSTSRGSISETRRGDDVTNVKSIAGERMETKSALPPRYEEL
ncbi:hypothetical protein GGX14DRAFT_475461 [Mycena pura]|uniref:Uncharacterized protein n=1 Tax=Mycena pura TaxID=153505 RepID=A0AAD6UYH8_9AGAR|nr:hypothetical protein GGX14DRAFT_475461 [Mycena pura]